MSQGKTVKPDWPIRVSFQSKHMPQKKGGSFHRKDILKAKSKGSTFSNNNKKMNGDIPVPRLGTTAVPKSATSAICMNKVK